MKVDGKNLRTIWIDESSPTLVNIIDQRKLPFELKIETLSSYRDVICAIKEMQVRGAPLIGVAGAFGVYLACLEYHELDPSEFISTLQNVATELKSARPTAVNLSWAVDRVMTIVKRDPGKNRVEAALREANLIAEEDVENCRKIGEHGVSIIERISNRKQNHPVNILTHCNAGWLACVDYGTATSPIYLAHDSGIKIHVWVDETRPRNQGARLTAWELGKHGVPHTLIVDNAGGHLMQHNQVDMVIVGSDRTTATGDVANKIGTYLKALAANDNQIPFYVALPSSTIDWSITDGIAEIPIEERDETEVTEIDGVINGIAKTVRIAPNDCKVSNFGFDVTPNRLVTGLITERGMCAPNKNSILAMFPERRDTR